MTTKKTGFAFITPFANYIQAKDQFKKDHPNVKLIEEIKNVFVADVEQPDTSNIININKTVKQQVIMIAYACVYLEKVKEEIKTVDQNL